MKFFFWDAKIGVLIFERLNYENLEIVQEAGIKYPPLPKSALIILQIGIIEE